MIYTVRTGRCHVVGGSGFRFPATTMQWGVIHRVKICSLFDRRCHVVYLVLLIQCVVFVVSIPKPNSGDVLRILTFWMGFTLG